jgi:hypothetical protein
MADASNLDDAALDALLDSTVTDDSSPEGYSVIGEESGSENVSPSDDIEEGQEEATEEDTPVEETTEDEESPEDSLSTEEEEGEDDLEEAEVDDESTEGTSEDDSKADLEADEKPVAFQPLRADGKEYPIESMQELYALASKGINAERKWQESAEGRRLSSTMKKNELTQDDLNLLVDIKKGNKEAITSLLKQHDIDPLDIDVDALDGKFKSQDYSTGDYELALEDVVSRISSKPRYEESVKVVMEAWDEGSKKVFYDNPKVLELLNIDMQKDSDGFCMYDTVAPIAEKMKALETGAMKTDLEYYQLAGQRVLEAKGKSESSDEQKQEASKAKEAAKAKAVKKKKKTVAPSGGRTAGTKVTAVEDMTDEELDALIG